MSLNKLNKQLRREIKSNPKKAAALGLLLLVAIYYWAPLLRGMIASEDLAAEAATDLPGQQFPASVAAQAGHQLAAATAREAPPCGWEDLSRWLNEDAATGPAETLVDRRDPFRSLVEDIVKAEIEPVDETPVQPPLTPEQAGMKLSGTVVGAGRRVALIGGKAYTEGRSVELPQNGQVIAFTLTEVHPQRIVLERLGEHFELALERATGGDGLGTRD